MAVTADAATEEDGEEDDDFSDVAPTKVRWCSKKNMGDEEDEENCSVLVLTPKNRSWRESKACKAVVVVVVACERLVVLRLVAVGHKSLVCTRLVLAVVVVLVHARIGGIHMMQLQSNNMPTTPTPRLLSRRACRRIVVVVVVLVLVVNDNNDNFKSTDNRSSS